MNHQLVRLLTTDHRNNNKLKSRLHELVKTTRTEEVVRQDGIL